MKRPLVLLLACAALAGCSPAATPPPVAAAPPPPEDTSAAERIKRFQYLYGSGEASVISIQAYHALLELARERVAARPADSVILAEGSTLADARFVPCGDKPFAAVFDVDETVLLNLGLEVYEAEGTPVAGRLLSEWGNSGSPAVAPVPGARFALDGLRDLGVTVIFNTNRDNTSAAGTAAQIEAIGLGPAVHRETLFLRGDADGASGKDGRRTAIAENYCVIAMGGDQLGDFFDAFNARGLPVTERRAAASRGWAARMWGEGWFMIPNSAYGPALQGGIDDLFPPDKRWAPATETAE